MCGVGLCDPLASFVLALVLLPPVLDPLLGDSALSGIDMIEHTVETEGGDHGTQNRLYLGGLSLSILPLHLIASVVVTGHPYSSVQSGIVSRSQMIAVFLAVMPLTSLAYS
jgi:hypothetical protein